MIVLILPALAVLAGAGPASATTTWQPAVNEDFPDPSVLDADGVYYAYSTEVGFDDVPYVTSTNGTQWSSAMGDALPALPSWASFGDTWGPTVARSADGQYVMFYAALDTSSGAECIGEAQSASPAGPFVDQNGAPVLCDPAEGGDIDPYIFADATTGQSYLIWKVNGNSIGQPSSLWAATLSPDLTLTGLPSQLLTDDQFWQADNIEGPAMVAEDGAYYLFYSANNYQGAAYAIGYATCASPLGPCADSPNSPMMVSGGGMAGPGGPALFFGPRGLEMAFSAWAGTTGYPDGGYRAMYLASVSFEDGTPHLVPVPQDESESSYWVFGGEGAVHAFNAPSFGSAPSSPGSPVVAAAATPDGGGYWTTTADGNVVAYGDAPYIGGAGGAHLNAPIVGIAATPDGNGYWLVAADGGIFTFGDAPYEGSLGGVALNRPIVGMAANPAGNGYWLVAADGGIFTFGAPFFGSTGSMHLNRPIVGMAATPDGNGYWLVAADGGIFTYGDAAFDGSSGDVRLNAPIVGMAATPDGNGYWLVAADGGIFTYGAAGFAGSAAGDPGGDPTVAVAAAPG